MTRVVFYILSPGASGNRYQLACRVAEKAWRQAHRVLIFAASTQEAEHMDRLLWSFRDQSFLPHGLFGKVDSNNTPVIISAADNPGEEHDVLINLAPQVPAFFGRFMRVAECVDHEQAARAASRLRFKYYRDRGYDIETIDVS